MTEPHIWVTADTHFGHANIIRHCARPFATADEMDEFMIAAWNERVGTCDVVWHLGDMFSFKKQEMDLPRARRIMERLNGRVQLLQGNHDVQSWLRYLPRLSFRHTPYEEVRLSSRQSHVVLCHYPLESWHGMQHGALHLHGHTHGTSGKVPRRVDVGVDCTGGSYAPILLDDILDGNP